MRCLEEVEVSLEEFYTCAQASRFVEAPYGGFAHIVLNCRRNHSFFGKALGNLHIRSIGMYPEPSWTAA